MNTHNPSKLLSLSALLLGALMLLTNPANAAKVAGVSLDESMTVAGDSLKLNGAGIRKRLFIKLYVGSLYTVTGAGSALEVIEADEVMAIRLNILSDLVTRKKIIGALTDGFRKSTGGNTAPIQAEIDQLNEVIPAIVELGTQLTLAYKPNVGTHIIVGEQLISVIEGLNFKQALFGIWLSDNPTQKSLKKAMLGS